MAAELSSTPATGLRGRLAQSIGQPVLWVGGAFPGSTVALVKRAPRGQKSRLIVQGTADDDGVCHLLLSRSLLDEELSLRVRMTCFKSWDSTETVAFYGIVRAVRMDKDFNETPGRSISPELLQLAESWDANARHTAALRKADKLLRSKVRLLRPVLGAVGLALLGAALNAAWDLSWPVVAALNMLLVATGAVLRPHLDGRKSG